MPLKLCTSRRGIGDPGCAERLGLGPVSAGEYRELLPKARVVADVGYKTIDIHIGAVVTGKLNHEPGKDLKAVELKPHIQH